MKNVIEEIHSDMSTANDDHNYKQDLVCQSGPFVGSWSKRRETETSTTKT